MGVQAKEGFLWEECFITVLEVTGEGGGGAGGGRGVLPIWIFGVTSACMGGCTVLAPDFLSRSWPGRSLDSAVLLRRECRAQQGLLSSKSCLAWGFAAMNSRGARGKLSCC